jgi:hypothetical protein
MGTTAAQKKLFFNLRKLKGQMQAIDEGDLQPETVKAIAERLEVTESDVVEMNRRLAGADHSLNVPLRSDSESQWQDWLVDDTASQETTIADADEYDHRMSLLHRAMTVLNERERHILSERRLKDEPMTLEELSAQYGISRERVRQIEVRAIEKLQRAIKGLATEQAVQLPIPIAGARPYHTGGIGAQPPAQEVSDRNGISARPRLAMRGAVRALSWSGVPGLGREQGWIHTELGNRALPLGLVVDTEHQLVVGRHHQPAVRLNLGIELARRPAGIADGDDESPRAAPGRDVAQRVFRHRQRHAGRHRDRRHGLVLVRVQQHHVIDLHRPAPMKIEHRIAPSLQGRNAERAHHIRHWARRSVAIDRDADSAIGRVRDHIDDRFREAPVGHRRIGDEELPLE